MYLKNSVLFNQRFNEAFLRLLKQPFPATITLQLVETLYKLSEKQGSVFKVRDELINRLGKIENDTVVFNSSEAEAEFNNEMNSLLNEEFEIPIKEKIRLTDKQILSGEDIIILHDILDINF